MPLRYAILRHEGIPEPHYDLMFETLPGLALSTWRSAAWPIEAPTPVRRLKDHRPAFLEFEGELTGHRGHVARVAGGACAVEIGEGAVWTVSLLTGAPPQSLVLRQIEGEAWEARPSD